MTSTRINEALFYYDQPLLGARKLNNPIKCRLTGDQIEVQICYPLAIKEMEKGAKMNHHTELVFILDKSGSMAARKATPSADLNCSRSRRRKRVWLMSQPCSSMTALNSLHDRLDIRFVQPISGGISRWREPQPCLTRSGTQSTRQKKRWRIASVEKANVIVVIITDGTKTPAVVTATLRSVD